MRQTPNHLVRQWLQSVGRHDYPHGMAWSLMVMGALAAAPVVVMWPYTLTGCNAQRMMMGLSASFPGLAAASLFTITASPLVRRTFAKAMLRGLLVGAGMAVCARVLAPEFFVVLCR